MMLCSLTKTYQSFGRICHMPEERGSKFLPLDSIIQKHLSKTPERKHVALRNSTVLMSQDSAVGTMTRLLTEQLRKRDSFPGNVKASDRP